MQYYPEMKSVNFGLVALLSSYSMICSPQRLLPAIQEEKIPHSRLLINMTVQSVHQIRRQPE